MRWLKAFRFSTLLFALLLGYFLVNVFTGQQGLLAWVDINNRSAGLEREAQALAAQRAVLQVRLDRLKADDMRPDDVEELAYRQLGFVAKEDIVVSLNGINPATAQVASPMPVAEAGETVHAIAAPATSGVTAR
jgi:cell division protein FtsB